MKRKILIFGFILIAFFRFAGLAQNPELTLQTGHSGAILNFAFSYDGKYLASVGEDNIIVIWDFVIGKQLKILKGHDGKINAIRFFNKNYNLITAGEDGKLNCWDIKTGNIIETIDLEKAIYSIDINKDDSFLAVGGLFPEIKIWKINEEFKFLKSVPVWDNKDSLRHIKSVIRKGEKVFLTSPMSKNVLFGNRSEEIIVSRATLNLVDKSILLCEVVQYNFPLGKISKIGEKANYIHYTNNYQNILMSVFPSRIINWNIIKNRKEYTHLGNFKKKNFTKIAVNANDSIVASLNDDGIIYVWKTTGQFLRTFSQPDFNTSTIQFNPKNENILVLGDAKGSITIYDILSGTAVKKMESGIHPISSIAINKSGTLLAIAGSDHIIRAFELKDKITSRYFIGHKDNISGLFFTTDSDFVSTGIDNQICKWNNFDDLLLNKVKGNSNPMFVNALINSPILSIFVNTISTYLFANNFLLHNYETLDAAAFNIKGSVLATGGKGFNTGIFYWLFIPRIFPVHIIDVDGLKKTAKLKAHYLSVNALDFNNSGSIIATCGNDYKTGSIISRKQKNTRHSAYPTYFSLKIWDLHKNEPIKYFENSSLINSVKFNPVNDTILFADEKNNLVIFDYKRDTAQRLTEGSGPLMFDYSGRNIFFQDKTNSLLKWDINQHKIVNNYKGHNNKITSSIIYPNGKQIATASLDGTVKIWDMEKGTEIVTLYAINNDDFILKTPDYYYYATKNAKKEIGFTFGIKFYPFEQFDLQYNRPDIVLSRLGIASEELIDAYYQAYSKRIRKMGFTEDMFENDFHLPEIKITNADKIPIVTNDPKIAINVQASDSKYDLNRISVWVNNVPLLGLNGINLRPFNIKEIQEQITINLSQGNNKIQVSCLNDKGVESLKESFEIQYRPQKFIKPDLYIVSVGASEYKDSLWNLKYAAKDAIDFSNLFFKQKGEFENVFVSNLFNKDVTIEKIRNIKNQLQLCKVDDIVMFFYAGHGLLDDSLNYYLATYNINFDKPEENGLKYEELDVLLDSIPSRNKIIFIDACHSGEVDKEAGQELVADNNVDKDIVFRGVKPRGYKTLSKIGYSNTFELMKEMFSDLRKGTGAVIVSSAGGGEFAFEGEKWKNGVFTYSLLNGVNTLAADKNKDNKITISELQDYIMRQVKDLTNGKQQPTMRQENIDNDFVIWNK